MYKQCKGTWTKTKKKQKQSIKYITGPPKTIHTEEKNWHNRNFLLKNRRYFTKARTCLFYVSTKNQGKKLHIFLSQKYLPATFFFPMLWLSGYAGRELKTVFRLQKSFQKVSLVYSLLPFTRWSLLTPHSGSGENKNKSKRREQISVFTTWIAAASNPQELCG